MGHRIAAATGLLALFLALTAADCVVVTKQVELPVRQDESFLFHTQGTRETTGSQLIDFRPALDDLERDNDFVELRAAVVEAGFWRVSQNDGDTDLRIQGSVSVTRVSTGAAAPFIVYSDIAIASVTGPFRPAPLEEEGLALLTAGFNEYLQARHDNQPLPDLKYNLVWTGSAASGNPDPNVDFYWEGKIKFTLVGIVEADVPDLWN